MKNKYIYASLSAPPEKQKLFRTDFLLEQINEHSQIRELLKSKRMKRQVNLSRMVASLQMTGWIHTNGKGECVVSFTLPPDKFDLTTLQ